MEHCNKEDEHVPFGFEKLSQPKNCRIFAPTQ